MKSVIKKMRKEKAKNEHTRRMKRLNDIAVALMENMTNTEKYKLVTGNMADEIKSFYKGLYRIV